MIDQTAIGPTAVQAPHHGGKHNKSGGAKDDGDDPKSFGDLVSQIDPKADDKAKPDALSVLDADEADMAVDDVDPGLGEGTVASSDVLKAGRIRLSTGFQQVVRDAAAAVDPQKGQGGKIEAKDQKTETRKDKSADAVDLTKVKEKPPASASEELSALLGLEPEADDALEETTEAPAGKPAGHHADTDHGSEAKTVKPDLAPAAATHAVKEDPAPVRAEAASGIMAAPHPQNSDKPAHAAVAGNSAVKTAVNTAVHVTIDDKPVQAEPNNEKLHAAPVDGKTRRVDIELKKKPEHDASAASSVGKTDFVAVLESRRYLGFSNDSNAGVLTGAIKADTSLANAIRNASIDGTSTVTEVNTLKLQMNPSHLGNMIASLRLKGDDLSVEVRVETMDAYRQLSKDHDGILRALKDQGFSVDQLTIQLSPPARQDASQDSGNQSNNGQNLREGQGDGARQRDDNSRRAGQNNWTGNDQTSTHHDSGSRADDRDAGNIYL
jgi:chemotaxis protein MotD